MKTAKSVDLQTFFIVTFGLVILIQALIHPIASVSSPSSANFRIEKPNGDRIFAGFVSIQQAINGAENGSMIFVPSGIYYERVIVNKTVSLVGEDNLTSIIDGGGSGTVMRVTAGGVTIRSLRLQNSGYGWYRRGIEVYMADNVLIKSNYLHNNCQNINLDYSQNSQVLENTIDGKMTAPTMYGIRIQNSTNVTVARNRVSDTVGAIHLENATDSIVSENNLTGNDQGIRFYTPAVNNKVFENTVSNSTYDGMIEAMPGNATLFGNSIFHNNFINNTYPFIYKVSGTAWDDAYPSGGNYWSRHNSTDMYHGPYQNETGDDGIGDTPYAINAYDADRYPLTHPYGSVRNLETNLTYLTIQSAINAPETLDRHTIYVRDGTYKEHVVANKTVSLIGENQNTTIIDGEGIGTVLTLNKDGVGVFGFTVRNSGMNFPPYGNDCGVLLDHSTGSVVSHSLITNNRIGIYLFYSANNSIENNIISSNREDGVWLWFSGNNTLIENRILNNSYNFGVFGGSFSDFNNNIATGNTIEGKPIQYVIGAEDKIFDNQTDIGALYLINCVNVTVRNLNLTKNGHGVFFYNVTDSAIENVTAVKNNYGVYLQNSASNIIGDNQWLDNWVGIGLQDSRYNVVENNIAQSGEKGISLYSASNNTIEGNTIRNALFGIRLFSSSSNQVSHNNLIENAEQVNLINSYQDVWDDGFEGNFWSDYVGTDVTSDGLGDGPYVIDASNLDQYPLLGIFHSFEIKYEGNSSRVTVITNSTITSLVFDSFNRTIKLTVNGSDGTYGFCRISVPHSLVEPNITVIIDNGLTAVIYPNYTIRDDGYRTWVYFAYQHSLHEIVIVPEFWPILFLSFLMVAAFWCLLIKKLKLN